MHKLPTIAKLNNDNLLVCILCNAVLKDIKAFNIHLRKEQHIRAVEAINNGGDGGNSNSGDSNSNKNVVKEQIQGGTKRKNDKKVEQIVPLFNYQINKKHNSGVVVEEYVIILSDEEKEDSPVQQQQPVQSQDNHRLKIQDDDDQLQEHKLRSMIDKIHFIKNNQKQKTFQSHTQQYSQANTDQLDFIKVDWRKK